MYKFSLKFDDKNHSLSAEKGLPIDILSELLKDLYKAIDLDKEANCTLSNIRGNCYALDFNSLEETHLERFKIVHKNLQDVPLNILEGDEKKYGITLKKVLGDDYYVVAYDENNNEVASIKEFKSSKEIKYYYTYQTIYGYLSELGGKSINSKTKHIKVDGYPFNIYIDKDLDLLLKPHYRTDKLSMKIKLKRFFEKGNVVSATMDGFKVVHGKTLMGTLKDEGFIDLNIFKEVTSIDGLIDSLYGGN
ncbi:hypothetical protein [uncultured Kriegella sp.]|uniref:hypothetical protein n=1 Tax=uncultured Kriegella sp. TaxID=1798910 RepID=UPI0030D75149|tara:strand:+ start:264883 stop:265626 length:744 start_codon:yes stop_codon:yes gene_type:complete